MESTLQSGTVSKPALWTGRILSTLVALFLLFDGFTKACKQPQVIAESVKMGFTVTSIVAIGIVLLVCVLLYVIPRTSILGAILLTGYLGGATAVNVHVHYPLGMVLLPVLVGVVVWYGLFLRDPQLRSMIPARK